MKRLAKEDMKRIFPPLYPAYVKIFGIIISIFSLVAWSFGNGLFYQNLFSLILLFGGLLIISSRDSNEKTDEFSLIRHNAAMTSLAVTISTVISFNLVLLFFNSSENINDCDTSMIFCGLAEIVYLVVYYFLKYLHYRHE
jgi:hypothetical protein